MDGFGWTPNETYGNAVAAAKKPFLDSLMAKYPMTTIEASGMAVGLPDGQMGNKRSGPHQHWRGPHCVSGVDSNHQRYGRWCFFCKSQLLKNYMHRRKTTVYRLSVWCPMAVFTAP